MESNALTLQNGKPVVALLKELQSFVRYNDMSKYSPGRHRFALQHEN
jgi:hypothetical protein